MGDVGLLKLAADFGSGDGGGGSDVNVDEAIARFEAIKAAVDSYRCEPLNEPNARALKAAILQNARDNVAFIQAIDNQAGVIWAHAQMGIDALKPLAPAR